MIYLYDGSFYGFLTCVYENYYTKRAQEIYWDKNYEGSLIDTSKYVVTDEIKAKKVEKAIRQKFSMNGYLDFYRSFLVEDKYKDCYIIRYIEKAFTMGKTIDQLYSDKDVLKIRQYSKRVAWEAHSYQGFMRFEDFDKYLYAAFEPVNNVLPLIAEHFADRYRTEQVMIHDKRRRYLMLSKDGQWVIRYMEEGAWEKQIESMKKSDEEILLQALWKTYFEHIAIEGRVSVKRQQQFVPLKYRKHITEFQ